MKKNNRRDFLKKGLMGISGAALLPGTLRATCKDPTQSGTVNPLPVRILGKTGLKVPLLSMGTGDTNNPALIKAALDQGVLLFGTSTYYGNGNNETMLGSVLKSLPRESYLVATSSMPKGTDHQQGLFTDPSAASAFQTDIEGSMKRLGVDYLDILFLPFAARRESVFFEPLLRVMEDFKKKGKARYLAIATHSYVDEAIKAAADVGIYDAAMIAYNFRMKKMESMNEAVAYAAKAGLGLIAMKTMAGGYWDAGRTQPIHSGAALKWALHNANIHTVMSGMTTFEELQRNVDLMNDLQLRDQDLKELKLAASDLPEGLYCLQCRSCQGHCSNNLDIPTLMRSYMYAYGYRNLLHAQDTLNLTELPDRVCDDCESCTVNCAAGFNVRQKIRHIARLKTVPREFLSV